jgi:hypothetical protein
MNFLNDQLPPQISADFDFSTPSQVHQDLSPLSLPAALTAPRYRALPEAARTTRAYRGYAALQPFELEVPYERSVSRISVRIAQAVESSRRILDLPENWDEEGGPAYTRYTWERATQFVIQTAIAHRRISGVWINPPKITPGPGGSIDVRWKRQPRSALINFPASEADPIQFFGSDGEIESIRGTLDLSTANQWILMWLIR